MARVRLIEDEEPSGDLRELLEQMTTILHMKTERGGPWHARAKGATSFGEGATPEEAMRRALALRGARG